jgi:hypothetical protein
VAAARDLQIGRHGRFEVGGDFGVEGTEVAVGGEGAGFF